MTQKGWDATQTSKCMTISWFYQLYRWI